MYRKKYISISLCGLVFLLAAPYTHSKRTKHKMGPFHYVDFTTRYDVVEIMFTEDDIVGKVNP